ncbi:MAG TPA: cell division protein ZapE [Leucothrix mucor]|nr:cell division protein ZapE [Leucothrix mucor]
MSLIERYNQKIADKLIEPDSIQADAVQCLQEIQNILQQQYAKPALAKKAGFFSRLFTPTSNNKVASVKGVYLWGGVGRGKTWLMDQFFKSTNIKEKRRCHFNHFMLIIHQALKDHPDQENPLDTIADEFAKDLRLLCLDELHLTEITNAMLLYPLLERLINDGVIIVTTSNRHPDKLYQGSIQAERFIPHTQFIKDNMQVINLDSGIDYRIRRAETGTTKPSEVYARNKEEMNTCFDKLAQGEVQKKQVLCIYDRDVITRQFSENIVWFDFPEICETTRTTSDYIWLSERYDVVMISNVPTMTADDDPAARRFFYLVDELYDRKVRFIFSAEAPLHKLYQGHRLRFAFKRTLSRLLAMHMANRLTC